MNQDEFYTELDKLFKKNRSDEVPAYLEDYLKRSKEDKPALVMIYNEMMGYYREKSEYDKALSAARESERLMEELEYTVNGDYAALMLNIGGVYRAINDFDNADTYYERAYECYRKLYSPDDYQLAEYYNNAALLSEEKGEFSKATEYLEEALRICKLYENTDFQIAVTYANLGASEIEAGELDAAWEDISNSIELFSCMGTNDQHFALALASMGRLCWLKKDFAEAALYYERALPMIEGYIGRTRGYNRVLDAYNEMLKDKEAYTKPVKAMDLAEDFYLSLIKPMIHGRFSEYEERIAVGKAGEGSDCFGFDDKVSRDHDFGPGLSLWLTEADFKEIGEDLAKAYSEAYYLYVAEIYRKRFPNETNISSEVNDVRAEGRTGVSTISGFFTKLTGYPDGPLTDEEYMTVPSEGLAMATNGKVFRDDLGAFTRVRSRLMEGYPERAKLIMLAEAIAKLGQAAQYNYPRALSRGDVYSAALIRYAAVKEAIRVIYLLNDRYMPIDKWLFAGLEKTKVLVKAKGLAKKALVMSDNDEEAPIILEKLCMLILEELIKQDLVKSGNDFLPDTANWIFVRAELNKPSVEELAEYIAKQEFTAFDKVKNEGGRANCQDDWTTFRIMRVSQYLAWTKEMLVQYILDFKDATNNGRNPITEKYGYMMESTVPWEFEKIKSGLPIVSEEKRAIVDAVCKIQVEWMEAFAAEYPGLAKNARIIHTSDDKPWDTSYETYLRGEMFTYSQTMLALYTRFIISLKNCDQNLAYKIMENTVHLYGYKDLKSAMEKNE